MLKPVHQRVFVMCSVCVFSGQRTEPRLFFLGLGEWVVGGAVYPLDTGRLAGMASTHRKSIIYILSCGNKVYIYRSSKWHGDSSGLILTEMFDNPKTCVLYVEGPTVL